MVSHEVMQEACIQITESSEKGHLVDAGRSQWCGGPDCDFRISHSLFLIEPVTHLPPQIRQR